MKVIYGEYLTAKSPQSSFPRDLANGLEKVTFRHCAEKTDMQVYVLLIC